MRFDALKRLFATGRNGAGKTWEDSQAYELNAAIDFVEGNNGYQALFDLDWEIRTGRQYKINSRSYMVEFFDQDDGYGSSSISQRIYTVLRSGLPFRL